MWVLPALVGNNNICSPNVAIAIGGRLARNLGQSIERKEGTLKDDWQPTFIGTHKAICIQVERKLLHRAVAEFELRG